MKAVLVGMPLLQHPNISDYQMKAGQQSYQDLKFYFYFYAKLLFVFENLLLHFIYYFLQMGLKLFDIVSSLDHFKGCSCHRKTGRIT